jgi:hypothetical protein
MFNRIPFDDLEALCVIDLKDGFNSDFMLQRDELGRRAGARGDGLGGLGTERNAASRNASSIASARATSRHVTR